MIILYWALEAQRVWLAAGLLLLGSFLAGSALWALAVTVVRGPGYAVTKSNPSLYLNSGDAESQKDLDNIEAAEEAEIPLLPHKAPVRPSHGSIMRSRSPSHHSSSSDSNNSSIQGIKSQGSTRSSNGSLSPEDLESDDGSSDWEDTDDDNTPLSAFMHTASKEVGHLVDTATPFVERVAAGGRLGEVGLSIQEASRGASLLAKANGQPRYCRKCSAPKPDRAHHCSSCDACVLQLDHHCAFLGSCVGHRNRRSFLQFLMYMSCFATYSFLLSMGSLFSSMTSQNNSIDGFATHVNWILVSFAGFVFSLILFPFTIFHIYLVVKVGPCSLSLLSNTLTHAAVIE